MTKGTHFTVADNAVVPSDAPLTETVSAKIVEVWDRAQAIASLMPVSVVVVDRQARLKEICDALNAVAGGGDAAKAIGTLDAIEKKVRSEQLETRCQVAHLARTEINLTLAFAVIVLTFYLGLRSFGFVASGGFEAAYDRNILQNIIGAVGWSALGFWIGLIARRFYEMQTLPFAEVAKRAERKSSAMLVALGNIALIVALFFSIHFGVSLVTSGVGGWTNIELPRSSILPGVVLGLTAPRIVKAALG